MLRNDESPLTDTEVHFLASEHVGDEFKVLVGHCGSPPAAVLYMGDTWANFGTAVEIIRLMRFTEVVPPLLVVGAGYRTTDIAQIEELRNRDFTPTVDVEGGQMDSYLSGEPGRLPAAMGGADRFLGFLRDELKPWVRERFGVESDDSMFFGDSLGGLFATHVLLSEPDAFRRYGIGSPALSRDKEAIFGKEEDYAKAHTDLNARVFFSVGGYENPVGDRRFLEQLPADRRAKEEAQWTAEGYTGEDYVGYCERMVAALRSRGYPSLQIECEVLPGEYHETAPPLNLSRSLRYLFDAPR